MQLINGIFRCIATRKICCKHKETKDIYPLHRFNRGQKKKEKKSLNSNTDTETRTTTKKPNVPWYKTMGSYPTSKSMFNHKSEIQTTTQKRVVKVQICSDLPSCIWSKVKSLYYFISYMFIYTHHHIVSKILIFIYINLVTLHLFIS